MNTLLRTYQSLLDTSLKIGVPLLKIAFALAVILIGWLIALVVQWVVVWFLKLIQLDKVAKRIKLTELLKQGKIQKTVSELIGDLVYWVIIFTTAVAALSGVGLPVSSLLDEIIAYLPFVIVSTSILAIAVFIAALISGMVMLVLGNLNISEAAVISSLVKYIVIIFGAIVALNQLGIATGWLVASFGTIILGAIGLAVAIAFGLGAKDRATEFLNKLFG